jgi:hypothetical protein
MIDYTHPTIASGATPIGSAVVHPMRHKIREGNELRVVLCRSWRQKKKNNLFEPILEKNSTIGSGATPIGSAGRALDEDRNIGFIV